MEAADGWFSERPGAPDRTVFTLSQVRFAVSYDCRHLLVDLLEHRQQRSHLLLELARQPQRRHPPGASVTRIMDFA
ncbi:hypothetical protein D7V97_22275 [Corallococcus sp. CA053C]|nr:hypothetical protein D7V97_22275 [Corallococcus sp. CA053C]